MSKVVTSNLGLLTHIWQNCGFWFFFWVLLGNVSSSAGTNGPRCHFGGLYCAFLGRKAMTNLDSILKSRDITLPTKVHLVKAMVFPVVMYGCESWIIKKLSTKELMLLNCGAGEHFWSPLDCKIQPVHPKGNQSWIFIQRTDTEAEAPILWPSDVKSQLTGKDPDAGKGGRQKKGVTEDEMVR